MAAKEPQKKSKSSNGKSGGRKGENLWDVFIHTKFRWWNIFTVGLVVFFIWAVTYEEPEAVREEPRCPYENYSGYDPTREVTEIVSVDYENRTVTYRPEGNDPLTGTMPRRPVSASSTDGGGTVIYDNNGKAHRIDAAPEEIVEQLRHEIDFDDLADQADYWPDDE